MPVRILEFTRADFGRYYVIDGTGLVFTALNLMHVLGRRSAVIFDLAYTPIRGTSTYSPLE